jgi:hypothetical protein
LTATKGVLTAPNGVSSSVRTLDSHRTGREMILYRGGERIGMSGKAKFILVLALIALVYFVVSGGEDPVEVDVDDE